MFVCTSQHMEKFAQHTVVEHTEVQIHGAYTATVVRKKERTSEVVAREGREVDNHRQRQEGGEAMKPHFNHRQRLVVRDEERREGF